jgi:putative two-component system response regulator
MIEERIHDSRILIVDDEPSSVRLLCAILARAGFENVRSTSDSREAIGLCEEFRPDLLLLDLHMPHLDGFAVLRQLSSWIQDSVYFPVLVLSADITHDARKRALSSGAKDFVNKPFDTTEVQLRIKNLLATRFLAVALDREKQLLEERVR